MSQIGNFLSDDDGAKVFEYGLLAALNAAAVVNTIRHFGQIVWQVLTDYFSGL